MPVRSAILIERDPFWSQNLGPQCAKVVHWSMAMAHLSLFKRRNQATNFAGGVRCPALAP